MVDSSYEIPNPYVKGGVVFKSSLAFAAPPVVKPKECNAKPWQKTGKKLLLG